MSLRSRLAAGVTVLLLLILTVAGVWARRSTEQELLRGIDGFLVERSEAFAGPDALTLDEHLALADGTFNQIRVLFAEPDALSQLVAPNGEVFGPPDQVVLPFDSADLDRTVDDEPTIRTMAAGDTEYRVLTTALPEGGLVQIGRDLSEANAVITNLTARLALAGVVTSVLLAAAVWVLVRRSLESLEAIAQATEELARTTKLDQPLPTGDDEVGRLARSFNTMADALAESRLRQQRLVEDAGHEIRTPLAGLLTSVEVLSHGDAVPENRRTQLLANAAQEGRELTKLVNELIDLATGSDRPERRPVVATPLSEIVESVAQRSRRRYPNPLVVEVVGAEPTVPLPVDVDLVGRAVSNLVDNAAKFSPEDGPIEIVVGDHTIEVRDRGTGFVSSELNLAFERFHRSVEARNLPGSGLGLAIVRQAAERHGGEVWARNRDGGGAAVGFGVVS